MIFILCCPFPLTNVTVQYLHSYEQKSIPDRLRRWDFCLHAYTLLRSAQQVRRPAEQLPFPFQTLTELRALRPVLSSVSMLSRYFHTDILPPRLHRYRLQVPACRLRIHILSGIPEEEVVRRTIHRYYHSKQAVLVREMIGNVYQECKGFGKKNGLTKEQYLNMQTEEFMNRRYEFRYNTQIGEVEYRERCSFYFRFRPLDKRAQNSILLDAQSEGIAVWDRDVDRYLHSNRVSVYNPLEEFIFHLPNWDKKDRITELADRVPCANPHWTMLFHRWFLNMVAHWRGYDRQHANSTSPLLVGAQGTRKSTFCRDLIPPGLRGYYTDSIDFGRKRDAEMYLNRFALINIDEFDQITLTQQGFLKHILQKPVVNLRKSYSNSVQELRRYASFIATSNQKDLLTDPSGSRRFMCVEVTGTIDTARPIDYEQLYAQAMYEICHGERYWFDDKDEAILAQGNREFEQTPPAIQLFYRYFKVAGDDKEGEYLSPVEILDYLQKRTTITLSSGKAHHFGRLLQKEGIPCKHTNKGTVYLVVKI